MSSSDNFLSSDIDYMRRHFTWSEKVFREVLDLPPSTRTFRSRIHITDDMTELTLHVRLAFFIAIYEEDLRQLGWSIKCKQGCGYLDFERLDTNGGR